MTPKIYISAEQVGNKILHRFIDEDGGRHAEVIDFAPTLYEECKEETGFTSIHGTPMRPIKKSTIKEMRDHLKDLPEHVEQSIHGMRSYVSQFLLEQYPDDIQFKMTDLRLWNIDIETITEKGMPDTDDPQSDVTAITVCDMNDEHTITWTTVKTRKNRVPNNKVFVVSSERDIFLSYFEWLREEEPDLITGWNIDGFDIKYNVNRAVNLWGSPSIRDSFSPFVKKFKIKNGAIIEKSDRMTGHTYFNIVGIPHIDYLKIFKKFTFTELESYSLDAVSEHVLGEKKIDFSDDYSSLDELMNNDPDLYIDYNIKDTQLVARIEKETNLLRLVLTLAYMAKIQVIDVLSQVKLWDSLIYNKLSASNVVVPAKVKQEKSEKYRGAFVKEPSPGLYDWVTSFDLNSLYPSLIMQYNISPETLVRPKDLVNTGRGDAIELAEQMPGKTVLVDVEELIQNKPLRVLELLKSLDMTMGANGAVFRKDVRGFLPEMMEWLYTRRRAEKNSQLEAESRIEQLQNSGGSAEEIEEAKHQKSVAKIFQMALKVCLNSAYGMIGNEFSRYYDVAIAEAITVSGMQSARHIERWINEWIAQGGPIYDITPEDYIIAMDTDSVYLRAAPFVERSRSFTSDVNHQVELSDQFANILQGVIEDGYQYLFEYMNAHTQAMVMKREVIAQRGLWRKKKNYALLVWDKEGVRYQKPKLKVSGLQSVKSSTPKFCRKAINETLDLIMTGTQNDVYRKIKEIKKEFYLLEPDDIGSASNIKNIDKWLNADNPLNFKSGTPMHVKGAIFCNYLIDQKGLGTQCRKVDGSAKVKILQLEKRNRWGVEVVSYVPKLPKELGLHDLVDYDSMYQKLYLMPIKSIFDAIGWSLTKKRSVF